MGHSAFAFSAFAVFLLGASPLRADSTPDELYPEPARPRFGIEIDAGLVVPVSTGRLCPSGSECLLGSGLALGLSFSRRWESGLCIGFAYEPWVLNANDVYEATVMQGITPVVQWTFLPDGAVHPLVRLRGGLLLLGESFRVDTVGGIAEVAAGAEVEVSDRTSFVFLFGGSVFRTASFTTSSDDTRRAVSGGVDATLALRIGYIFLL